MPLKAIKIVEEVFDKEIEHQRRNGNGWVASLMRTMKGVIVRCIKIEYIGQDDPEEPLPEDCYACGVLKRRCFMHVSFTEEGDLDHGA